MQTQTYDVEGPVRLRIDNTSGDVRVTGTAGGRAEVEVTALRDDEASREAAEHTTVDLRGNDLSIEVPRRRGTGIFGRDAQVRVDVRVPADSAFHFTTASADVRASGTLGEVRGKTASGDVSVEDAAAVRIETASGDVHIDSARGETELRAASGDIKVGHVAGRLQAKVVSGNLSVLAADHGGAIEAVSGDIDVKAVAQGDVDVKTVSGDVTLGVPRGTRVHVDVSTLSGELKSEVELDEAPGAEGDDGPLVAITGRTVSGDLRVRRA